MCTQCPKLKNTRINTNTHTYTSAQNLFWHTQTHTTLVIVISECVSPPEAVGSWSEGLLPKLIVKSWNQPPPNCCLCGCWWQSKCLCCGCVSQGWRSARVCVFTGWGSLSTGWTFLWVVFTQAWWKLCLIYKCSDASVLTAECYGCLFSSCFARESKKKRD